MHMEDLDFTINRVAFGPFWLIFGLLGHFVKEKLMLIIFQVAKKCPIGEDE